MHGRFFLGLAVLTAAILVGCGGGSGKRDVAAGELAVSPSVLDFGKVAVGSHKGKTDVRASSYGEFRGDDQLSKRCGELHPCGVQRQWNANRRPQRHSFMASRYCGGCRL